MGHQFRDWDQAGPGTGLAQGQTQIDYAAARLEGLAGGEGPSGGWGGVCYSVQIGLRCDSFCPPYFYLKQMQYLFLMISCLKNS